MEAARTGFNLMTTFGRADDAAVSFNLFIRFLINKEPMNCANGNYETPRSLLFLGIGENEPS